MKPFIVTRLIWVLSLSLAGSCALGPQVRAQAVEYRLLHKTTPRPGDPVPGFGYAISVDGYLTRAQFKELVCQVIRDQRPEHYRHLAIVFAYRLDSFSGVETEEFAERMIGSYRWSRGDSHRYSLGIFVDSSGTEVPAGQRLHPFDHLTDCPAPPRETPHQ